MKMIFKILIFCGLLCSCSSNSKVEDGIGAHIDSEIEERLALLKTKSDSKDSTVKNYPTKILELDTWLRKITGSINLYDSATNSAARADSCFGKQASLMGIEKTKFMTLSAIGYKDDIVIGIKFNELVLLDHLLLTK
ncbi:hypothetical protein CNR22_08965 [Sphingobacteriaceae bacterium]|nr:hypothetical protein CNR22_08965 [Sphingobacteriaceae bacterium]